MTTTQGDSKEPEKFQLLKWMTGIMGIQSILKKSHYVKTVKKR